jgi:hypothetical protein
VPKDLGKSILPGRDSDRVRHEKWKERDIWKVRKILKESGFCEQRRKQYKENLDEENSGILGGGVSDKVRHEKWKERDVRGIGKVCERREKYEEDLHEENSEANTYHLGCLATGEENYDGGDEKELSNEEDGNKKKVRFADEENGGDLAVGEERLNRQSNEEKASDDDWTSDEEKANKDSRNEEKKELGQVGATVEEDEIFGHRK